MEPRGHLHGVLTPALLTAWSGCLGVACRVWREKRWIQRRERSQNMNRKAPEEERIYRDESQAKVLAHPWACEVTGVVLGPGLPWRELLEQNMKGPNSMESGIRWALPGPPDPKQDIKPLCISASMGDIIHKLNHYWVTLSNTYKNVWLGEGSGWAGDPVTTQWIRELVKNDCSASCWWVLFFRKIGQCHWPDTPWTPSGAALGAHLHTPAVSWPDAPACGQEKPGALVDPLKTLAWDETCLRLLTIKAKWISNFSWNQWVTLSFLQIAFLKYPIT